MRGIGIALLGFALAITPSDADAQCIEHTRNIELNRGNIVALRSYLCRTIDRTGELQFKVEFLRFSEMATSMLFAKSSSRLLERTVGTPMVFENEVFGTYMGLLTRFGTTKEDPTPSRDLIFRVSTQFGGLDELIRTTYRTIGDSTEAGSLFFPAAEEIQALNRKQIPPNMNFYHFVHCLDDAKSNSKSCDHKTNDPKIIFWRGLQASDLLKYPQNLAGINAILKEAGSDDVDTHVREYLKSLNANSSVMDILTKHLRLANEIAGASWPDDFLILTSENPSGDCPVGVPPTGNWDFVFWPRNIVVDAISIENISRQPLRLGGLLGNRSLSSQLRAAPPLGFAGRSYNLITTQLGALAPGQKLLVPTRISFVPHDELVGLFKYSQTAEQLYREHGTWGFRGQGVGHGPPPFRDYVYGHDLAVTGILANDSRVSLTIPTSNFIDVTISGEKGSCPFLLSWDKSEWIDQGKVLHKAPDRAREYTETRVFPGFQARFRLEEREPEVASIDQAELTVTLKSGATLAIAPDHPRLAARDGDYLRLMWGDAVEFAFTLPEGIDEAEVVQSQLAVTGYYERYTALLAGRNTLLPATPVPKARVARPTLAAAAISCPRPDAALAGVRER